MNRSTIVSLGLVIAAGSVGGCTDLRHALGIEKSTPDEFTVVQNAPLTLPPDYGLRPPHSAGKPASPDPMNAARVAVFKPGQRLASTEGAPDPGGTLTAGEQSLLLKAGALNADPAIRGQVDAETAGAAAASNGFVDSLLFWKSPPVPGQPVNAASEDQRVRADEAEGKSVTTPQPTIEQTQRTLMEGLF